jgi:hemerythrin
MNMGNNNHNFTLAINLIKAVRNKDFNYMLSIFPEGVEYKGYKFTTEEDFMNWDNYEEYMRYYAKAQDMMIENAWIKLLNCCLA